MKKRVIAMAMAAVIMVGGVPVMAAEAQAPAVAAETIEEMQAAIVELREMVQVLVAALARAGGITPSAPTATPAPRQERLDRPERTSRADRPARPENPPITRERAIEIAFAYAGTGGVLDDVELDFERGQWVWEIEIDFPDRRELEIYVDVNTGEVLWSEWD